MMINLKTDYEKEQKYRQWKKSYKIVNKLNGSEVILRIVKIWQTLEIKKNIEHKI